MSLKGIKVNGTAYTIDYDELDNKPSVDAAPTENSDNLVKSGGVYTALSGKQDSLNFDSAPTENSTNPVTSGGIKNALDNISVGSSPDWEQFDSSASDYIKNRPMYKDYVYTDYILNELAVSGSVSSQTGKAIYNPYAYSSKGFIYYKSLLTGTPLVVGRNYKLTITRSGSGNGYYIVTNLSVTCYGMKKDNSSGTEIPFIHCHSAYGNNPSNYYYLAYGYALMLWYDPDDDAIYIGGNNQAYFSNYTYTITLQEDDYDTRTLSNDLLPDPEASKYAPEFADDSYAPYSSNAYNGYILVNDGAYYRIPFSEAVRKIILLNASFEDGITNYDFVGDDITLPGIIYNIIKMLKTHGTSISTLRSENATLKSRVQKLKNQLASVVEQLNEQGIDVSISESIELEDGYLVTDAELEDGWLALDSAEITDGYITTD